jgi:outer membrane protein assembly factor BamB
MKKVGLVLVCLIALTSVALQPFASADWSMFRSNSLHDGVGTSSSTTDTVSEPTQLWQSNLKWNPVDDFQYRVRDLTEPAVVSGVLYVGAESSVTINRYQSTGSLDMYALNDTNGEIIWDFKDTSSNALTPPAIGNDMVYFATDSYVCALNANEGSLVWNFSTFTGFSYPVVLQDMLLIGTGEGIEGALAALNATNGHVIWRFTNFADSRTFHTPAIADGQVFVTSFDGNMYALNLGTGEEVWSYQAGFSGCPVVAGNIVYGITGDANVYALDCTTGDRLWNYSMYDGMSTDQEPYFSIYGNVLYARNGGNKIYAFNALTGSKIWSTAFSQNGLDVGVSVPTVVNNTVYVGSEKGLYALDCLNGEIIWKYNDSIGFGSPIVVDGILYVTSNEQVYAIQIPSPIVGDSGLIVELAFVILAVSFIAIVVTASLLLYRWHRKTTNKKQ